MSSRTLVSRPSQTRSARWYGVPLRVALLTFVGTLLSFSLLLLVSIVGTVIVSALRGLHPDMRTAYHIALPLGLVACGIIFLVAIVTEVRQYHQSKALERIERMS